MADLFSTFAGAVNVAEVCVRLSTYIKKVYQTTKGVDHELDSLSHELISFKDFYTALAQLHAISTAQQKQTSDKTSPDDPCTTLWSRAIELIQEGQNLVGQLERLLGQIQGPGSSESWQKLDHLRKALKILSRDDQYSRIRQRFSYLNLELNTMITAIDLTSNSLFRSSTYSSLEEIPGRLSQELQGLGLKLKAQIEALEKCNQKLEPSILSAKAAVRFASLNHHFYVSSPDTSIWTGRGKYLEDVKDALLLPNPAVEYRTQKRYVVYGIAGSGKTQFCCKFAQDYRESPDFVSSSSFWGIFWVDASSPQNATESWKRIAKLGGRDSNEEAGKHWLSNLQSPWLLVIDSIDHSEDTIRSHFPGGERGCVLITSRNPRLRISATVGHLAMDKLEEDEADDLLRKATSHEPWDASAKNSASSIAKHLGYLPLALIHAGRAILHQLTTLQGYIPWFNRTLDDFRLKRPLIDDDLGMGAFTSFDIIYTGLEARAYGETPQKQVCKDAIELLNVFSFFHSNDVRLDTLIRTGQNLQTDAKRRQTSGSQERTFSDDAPKPLMKQFKDLLTELVARYYRQPSLVPQLFGSGKSSPFDESRVRRAMDVLVRMSLISESSEAGCYSLHPLVHVWVRKRLSIAEQALWCQAAADVLGGSIKLPPLEDGQGDSDYYLRILPHVNQILFFHTQLRQGLRQRQDEARTSLWRAWFWSDRVPGLTSSDASNSARYSRVYMQCAKYKEAEELQRLVRDYLVIRLGRQHPLYVRVQLALSASLWHQGKTHEAVSAQEDALSASRAALGESHAETLRILDALGESCWQRGQLKEAKALHEAAIAGMQHNSSMTCDLLRATDHLGRVHGKYFNYELSRQLHQRAVDGLTAALGATDHDTLVATSNLATTLLEGGGDANIDRAHDLLQRVLHIRQHRLGREHAYTLWAMLHLARVKAAQGHFRNDRPRLQEAGAILTAGLEVATRNLGPDHIGTLAGRRCLANTLVLEGRYGEAEPELLAVMALQKDLPGARAGTHPDRLGTMENLAHCYGLQGRWDECRRVCEELCEELHALGGSQHAMKQRVTARKDGVGPPII